ncbi:MAG: DUF348 domain-containing protein [Firmicutes bacterium]|nr:DUF348 domain-containing protein [Bacillota bacterium]
MTYNKRAAQTGTGGGNILAKKKIPIQGIYKLAAFIVLAMLGTVVATGYFMHVKHVTVYVGENQLAAVTAAQTVGEALTELGLDWREEDYVYPEPDTTLSRRMGIVVIRAQRFTVNHDGESTEVWSVGKKVGDILEDAGVQYFMQDIVTPPSESQASLDEPINVVRVQSQLVEKEIIESYSSTRVPNPNMYQGQERVVQHGRDGKSVQTIEVTYHDGEAVEETIVDTREVVERRDKITEYGTISSISRSGYDIRIRGVVDTLATAYCAGTPETRCPLDDLGRSACTGAYNTGYTSTGMKARQGSGTWEDPYMIAVDPRVIPLRSKVYLQFPGGQVTTMHGTIIRDGFAVAVDVGSAIRGNRIDIVFDDHYVAWYFGRKSVRVFLVDSVSRQ